MVISAIRAIASPLLLLRLKVVEIKKNRICIALFVRYCFNITIFEQSSYQLNFYNWISVTKQYLLA